MNKLINIHPPQYVSFATGTEHLFSVLPSPQYHTNIIQEPIISIHIEKITTRVFDHITYTFYTTFNNFNVWFMRYVIAKSHIDYFIQNVVYNHIITIDEKHTNPEYYNLTLSRLNIENQLTNSAFQLIFDYIFIHESRISLSLHNYIIKFIILPFLNTESINDDTLTYEKPHIDTISNKITIYLKSKCDIYLDQSPFTVNKIQIYNHQPILIKFYEK